MSKLGLQAFARFSTLGTWTVELFALDSSAARVSLGTWTINVVPASAPDKTSIDVSSIVLIACTIGGFLGLVMIIRGRWAKPVKPTHTASDTGGAPFLLRPFPFNDDDNDSSDISLTQLTSATSDYEDIPPKVSDWSRRT